MYFNWIQIFFCGRTSLTARMKISMQTELICPDKSLIPKGEHFTGIWKAWAKSQVKFIVCIQLGRTLFVTYFTL